MEEGAGVYEKEEYGIDERGRRGMEGWREGEREGGR